MADETPTPASPAPAETPATPANPTPSPAGDSATLLGGGANDPASQAPGGEESGQAKPEGETSGDGTGEGEGEESGKEAKPEGAPEKYDFKNPEGTQIDPTVLEQYGEVARELDLSQEAAQKIVDKIGPVMAQRQAEAIQAVQAEWLNATKADKEFGGDKLAENVGVAQKALATFGTPELKTLLDQSGLGNHPEIVRLLWKAGKTIGEDKFVGGHASQAQASALSKLYPTN